MYNTLTLKMLTTHPIAIPFAALAGLGEAAYTDPKCLGKRFLANSNDRRAREDKPTSLSGRFPAHNRERETDEPTYPRGRFLGQ